MTAVELYNSLNLIERQNFCEMFAKDVLNKFDQELITKRREEEIRSEAFEEGFQEGIEASFGIMIDMYWNHWRDTLKKNVRLKNAYKMFIEKLGSRNNITKKQHEAQVEFVRQTGEQLIRGDNK